MMNNKEIGTRIAVLRKGMGDSQAKLAERLDVSPQAVSKWETGQSLPDIGNLLKLSWLFRTSINHILEGSRPGRSRVGCGSKKSAFGYAVAMSAMPQRIAAYGSKRKTCLWMYESACL